MVLYLLSCQDNVEVHISKTIIFEGQLFELNSEDPFSGIIYNTYSNGKREYEGKYINGRPTGMLIYWYENGKKMREGKLKNGSPVGRWNYYNANGAIQKSIDY